MKKAVGIFLLFAWLVTLCGCQNDDVDIRGKYENDASNFSSDAPKDTNASTEKFSLGKTKANVYESDFIGIRYTLDDNWSFYDDKQIKELNKIAVDLAGDEVEKLLEDATIIYDMYASDSDQLNNININLEKVNISQLVELDIAENFKTLMPILKDSFSNMGYENINLEIGKVEVDGKTLDAIHTTAEINGVNMYQTIFQKKCNGYLASMTVTTFFEDTTADLLDNFRWTK